MALDSRDSFLCSPLDLMPQGSKRAGVVAALPGDLLHGVGRSDRVQTGHESIDSIAIIGISGAHSPDDAATKNLMLNKTKTTTTMTVLMMMMVTVTMTKKKTKTTTMKMIRMR